MEKKHYQQPSVRVHEVRPTVMLDGSTGATGSDVPWGAKGRFSLDNDEYEENTLLKNIEL